MKGPSIEDCEARLERRPSEFDAPAPIVLHTGSCCCCCCLHWVGAAIGGAAGLAHGWRSRDASIPMHPKARNYILTGMLIGLGLTVVAIFLAVQIQWASFIVAMALAPCLAFALVGAGPVLGAMWAARNQNSRFDPEGVYCLNCLYDMRGSLESGRCPECGSTLPDGPHQHGMDLGGRTAWRMALLGFLYSLGGTVIAYAAMFVIAQLYK